MAEELARVRRRNAELQMKLEQIIKDRDTERRKANEMMVKLKKIEKERQEEFVQYRTDIDNLIAEKNELSASYTSSAEYNVFDTDEMSPSEVIDDHWGHKDQQKYLQGKAPRGRQTTTKENSERGKLALQSSESDISPSSSPKVTDHHRVKTHKKKLKRKIQYQSTPKEKSYDGDEVLHVASSDSDIPLSSQISKSDHRYRGFSLSPKKKTKNQRKKNILTTAEKLRMQAHNTEKKETKQGTASKPKKKNLLRKSQKSSDA
ncbi:uncharacterized protein [Montipora capricornis]|uniref:uncharacterized protein n=1 Tax=Montipora capricornis TaxID=246305 RepID=UPI0035F1622E